MSSGGGDGGASKRQAEIEKKKQQARDALNALFGESPTSLTAPTREQFTKSSGPQSDPITPRGFFRRTWGAPLEDQSGEKVFDQAGYDKAMADYQAQMAAPGTNKAAREKLYGDIRTNAFTAGKRSLEEQSEDARRNLRFELFARGLNGGSTDIDQNARLQRKYDQGILDLGAKADSVAADVRGNDEQTRLGLLQSIDAGMDQGSAISSALTQMRINGDKAAAGAAQTTVDDLFSNAGLLYQQQRRALGEADARNQFLYGNNGTGRRSTGSTTGTISTAGYP